MKYLEVCLQTSIFAPLFNRKRISLDYGVMVAQQVLVLFVQVRILVVQQSNSLEDTKKVCQNAPLLSFTHKAPTFTSWGFVIT